MKNTKFTKSQIIIAIKEAKHVLPAVNCLIYICFFQQCFHLNYFFFS